VIFKASHVLAKNGNDKHAHVMAGPQAHWAKVAFEQVFIGSRKRGVLALKTRIAGETHGQH
jgi:sulfide:quinone oxidoreductase